MNELRRRVLAFESSDRSATTWGKAKAIREEFGFALAVYEIHLVKALEDPASDEIAPEVVERYAARVARLRALPVVAAVAASYPTSGEVLHF